MMNIARSLVIAAPCLLFVATHGYLIMGLVVAQITIQAELMSQATGDLLAELWAAVASMLFTAAAACSAIRNRRRRISSRARPDTETEKDWTRAFADLVDDVFQGVMPLVFPLSLSAAPLIFALNGLGFLGSSEAISWPTCRILGYGPIATAWAGAIAGSVWTILHPEAVTFDAEGENAA